MKCNASDNQININIIIIILQQTSLRDGSIDEHLCSNATHNSVMYRQFLPARRYASAGLCDSDVSVRPSIRHTPVLCLAERKQDREMYTI